jgi:hypothetical protein
MVSMANVSWKQKHYSEEMYVQAIQDKLEKEE